MKHLVLFCDYLDMGGLERYVLQLAEGATEAPRVTILGGMTERFVEHASEIPRVDLVEIPKLRPTERVAPLALARRLRDLDADLIHTQDISARVRGHLAGRLAGVPTVHTVHMSPFYYPGLPAWKRTAYRWAERAYRSATDAFIFVSHVERELYLREGVARTDQAVTVHNGVPPLPAPTIDPVAVRRAVGCDPDAVLATFVGRLAVQKGLDFLIDAAAQLDDVPVQVLVIGYGEEEEALKARAASLPPGRLVFGGYQPQERVQEILAASDLFVLPSRFECFPYATLEALRAGLPCVVTDVGGNREAVTDGVTGRVVPAGNPPALAAAIRELALDPDRRRAMSEAAETRAHAFSVEAMLRRTERVYDAVLRDTPLPA